MKNVKPTAVVGAILAVIVVAGVAIAATSGGDRKDSTRTSTHVSPAGEANVERAFAVAYLRYLNGQAPGSALPDTTAAARAAAVQGGTIPPAHRKGPVVLVSLKPAAGVAGGVLITARNDAGTLYAQETVSETANGPRVTNVLTPDFVQVFAKQTTAQTPEPAGSASPQATAQTFLNGYVPWFYGHGPMSAIKDASGALLAHLKAHPPNIPPAMAYLQGQVKGVAMQRQGSNWQALVNVHDAVSTYQLTLTLKRLAGGWTVTEVTSQ